MAGFDNVLIVAAVAFAAPLLLGLVPAFRLPAVVLELVAGIVVGPAGFGWAKVDEPVEVLSLLGLAFLLLLAGLEVDFERLRGPTLGLAGAAFAVSLALALALGGAFRAAGLVRSPLLIGFALAATGLGIVIPVLKDAGETGTPFGTLTIAGASIAEVATIVLLSLFFSAKSGGLGAKLVLLTLFAVFVLATGVAVAGAARSMRISATLVRLQDTTAQIRVRGAFLLLAVFVVFADRFGLEAILGAFLAGATLKLVDTDRAMTHPAFRSKLEAVGFGVFVPFFFVTSGLRFDLDALFASGATVARVPLFLVALLAARGLPAALYARAVGTRRAGAAGLLQATSLSFLVVAGRIGTDLGLITPANNAALVAAGLLSVLLFPLGALTLLSPGASRETPFAAPLPPRV